MRAISKGSAAVLASAAHSPGFGGAVANNGFGAVAVRAGDSEGDHTPNIARKPGERNRPKQQVKLHYQGIDVDD